MALLGQNGITSVEHLAQNLAQRRAWWVEKAVFCDGKTGLRMQLRMRACVRDRLAERRAHAWRILTAMEGDDSVDTEEAPTVPFVLLLPQHCFCPAVTLSRCLPCCFFPCICFIHLEPVLAQLRGGGSLYWFQQNCGRGSKLLTRVTKAILGDGFFIKILLLGFLFLLHLYLLPSVIHKLLKSE